MNKMINIKFWDNEKYEYPLLRIDESDLKKFENILKEYQKDDEYNFDDFLRILEDNKIKFEEITNDIELFF